MSFPQYIQTEQNMLAERQCGSRSDHNQISTWTQWFSLSSSVSLPSLTVTAPGMKEVRERGEAERLIVDNILYLSWLPAVSVGIWRPWLHWPQLYLLLTIQPSNTSARPYLLPPLPPPPHSSRLPSLPLPSVRVLQSSLLSTSPRPLPRLLHQAGAELCQVSWLIRDMM